MVGEKMKAWRSEKRTSVALLRWNLEAESRVRDGEGICPGLGQLIENWESPRSCSNWRDFERKKSIFRWKQEKGRHFEKFRVPSVKSPLSFLSAKVVLRRKTFVRQPQIATQLSPGEVCFERNVLKTDTRNKEQD